MPWVVRYGATDYPILDASKSKVSCELSKLNEAKVICAAATPLDVNTTVKIVDRVVDPNTKTIVEDHEILHGKVEKYTQITKGVTTNTYEYKVKELAVELEKFRINSGGSYTVNCASQTVSLYAASVLNNSTWSATTGCPGSNVLEALQFRFMTGLAGLNKIITELGAASAATPFYLWFFPNDKKVGWGEYRNDRTSVNFIKGIYYNYEEFKTVRAQASGVVIYGANSAYSGQYPSSPAGHDLAVYQYDDATSNAECANLAFRVYTDYCKDPKRRIQFVLRPEDTKVGGAYILEGDRIQVDGVNYTIMDMTYSPKEVLVGVNAGEESILYALGDKLKPLAGTASGASEVVWNPGTQNVASDGTTKSKFQMQLSNVANILDATVMLNVEIGAYKAYSYQNAAAATNFKLTEVTVPGTFKVYNGVEIVPPLGTKYIPSTDQGVFMKSATVFANGFQYAIATINFTVWDDFGRDNDNAANLWIMCQYSYNGTTWFDGTYQQKVALAALPSTTNTHTAIPVSQTYSIPGTNDSGYVYVRWKVYNDQLPSPGVNVGWSCAWITGMLDVFPRHDHIWSQDGAPSPNYMKGIQTDDLKEVTSPTPSSVTCSINGASHTFANNVPQNIKDHLITGINNIEFTAASVCTVTPSTTFKMFGT